MISTVVVQMSLLEWLAYRTNSSFISDLKYLEVAGRTNLLHQVEQIRPEAASLSEWNEALDYLVGAHPCESTAEAKRQLITLLDGADSMSGSGGSEQSGPASIHVRRQRPARSADSAADIASNG